MYSFLKDAYAVHTERYTQVIAFKNAEREKKKSRRFLSLLVANIIGVYFRAEDIRCIHLCRTASEVGEYL